MRRFLVVFAACSLFSGAAFLAYSMPLHLSTSKQYFSESSKSRKTHHHTTRCPVSQWFKKAKTQGAEAFGCARAGLDHRAGGGDDPAAVRRQLSSCPCQSPPSSHQAESAKAHPRSATQRDEDAITTWKEERWPALKKSLKRKSG